MVTNEIINNANKALIRADFSKNKRQLLLFEKIWDNVNSINQIQITLNAIPYINLKRRFSLPGL